MIIQIGSLTLPNYTEISRIESPSASENITLDGSLYIDYFYKRRGWKIKYNLISADDYDDIKTLYDLQFSSGVFNNLTISDYSISAVPVYMKINESNIKYNGSFIEGFELELLEQNAV